MRKFVNTAMMCLSMCPTSLLAKPAGIDIMFYNVYNLFDAQHDEGKDDWTFLPRGYPGKDEYCASVTNSHYREECYSSNWNERSVEIKIAQLADAIRDATEGALPDMIGLCEVENANVVRMLAEELGYKDFVVSDSPDSRGIDVALIYRPQTDLSFQGKYEYVLKATGPEMKATRNVLEVEFKVGNERLYVYVNHWPSQAAPASVRVNVAEQVQTIVDQRIRESRQNNILLMGDFNVVDGDYPHPFKGVLLNRDARNPLSDVGDMFSASRAPREIKNKMPYGTYFYPPRMSWDRLDRFFVNHSLHDGRGLEIDATSYRILTPERIQKTMQFNNQAFYSNGTVISGIPYRANILATNREDAGYSDHFPVLVRIKK